MQNVLYVKREINNGTIVHEKCTVGFSNLNVPSAVGLFTGEEVKLYDGGEEVSPGSNYQRTEITEAAVSGEHCNASTSKTSLPVKLSVSKEQFSPNSKLYTHCYGWLVTQQFH